MQSLTVPDSLDPFVKEIFFLRGEEEGIAVKLPFYADGFAGIIHSKSLQPFRIQPYDKQLSDFYLYGQTVEPISLEGLGKYEMLALRLYPFVVKVLLGVSPKILVDDCYDLRRIENMNTSATIASLNNTENLDAKVSIVADYFNGLVKNASFNPNHRVKLATNLILKSKGTLPIKEIRSRLHVAERTFERHFAQEIGVTPKQFAKIIQFSTSMNQIKEEDYAMLSDVGYDSGFADQSHFIRTFKRYTGKTPQEFQKQISA